MKFTYFELELPIFSYKFDSQDRIVVVPALPALGGYAVL